MNNTALLFFILFCTAYLRTVAQRSDDLKLANEYYGQQEYTKALDIYRYLAKKKESILELHSNYFQILLDQQHYDEARTYLERITQLYPNELRFKTDQVYLSFIQDDQRLTSLQTQALQKQYQKNSNVLRTLAMLFDAKEMYSGALQLLMQARVLSGNNLAYALDFATIYEHNKNPEKMILEYLNYASQRANNMSYVKSLFRSMFNTSTAMSLLVQQLIVRLQEAPDNPFYAELLMWAYLQENDFYAAFIQAKAIDKKAQLPGTTVLSIAAMASENQFLDAAGDMFAYLIKTYPKAAHYEANNYQLLALKEKVITDNEPANLNKLTALTVQYQEFFKQFGPSINGLEALRHKALIHAFYLNEPDTAVAVLNYLIDHAGSSQMLMANSKMNLADVYLVTDQPWEASLLYSQVEKSNPYSNIGYQAKLNNARLQYYMHNFDLAKSHLDILKQSTTKEIANDAEALSLFIDTNTLNDTNQVALADYAHIDLLIFRNQYDSAIQALNQLIANNIGHPIIDDCYWLLGNLEERLGNYNKAIAFYEVIIGSYSDGVLGDDALYQKAEIIERKLQDPMTAQQVYREFLNSYPGSAYAAEARKRYRSLRGDDIN